MCQAAQNCRPPTNIRAEVLRFLGEYARLTSMARGPEGILENPVENRFFWVPAERREFACLAPDYLVSVCT
jgi:hypothetical protein